MRTEGMDHQLAGCARMLEHDRTFYAMGAEQGTGKTWMLLSDLEHAHAEEGIDAALVIAPKGVHTNWVRREIPAHLSAPHRTGYYVSGMGKRAAAGLDKLIDRPYDGVKILAMNIDALITRPGLNLAARFLRTHRATTFVDESQRIKNPRSARTKKAWYLGELAQQRRVSSGTLVADKPIDVWGQFEFLRSGLLGTTSYRAFVAEYSELLPEGSPIVQEAMRRARGNSPVPQIPRRDERGIPIFRNLSKLRGLIAPHTYRVLKADCLDLPEKIYTTRYYELTPRLRRAYNRLREEARWERGDGDIDIFTALTLINKLRQAAAGFVLEDGRPQELSPGEEPRLSLLREAVSDARAEDASIIIWATHRAELAMIAQRLRADGLTVGEYHGGVGDEDREAAVDGFQAGELDVFLSNPQSGGAGLTLTAASVVIYYSSDFSLEQRVQSEDRSHRRGTRHPVLYIDLVALDTVDERVAAALQAKREAAAEIMGDL